MLREDYVGVDKAAHADTVPPRWHEQWAVCLFVNVIGLVVSYTIHAFDCHSYFLHSEEQRFLTWQT